MPCNICIYWTPLTGCDHQKPAILTVKLNNGIMVLAKEVKGKLCAVTFANNLQAETQQILTVATGTQCEVYTPAMSRVRYIRIIKK